MKRFISNAITAVLVHAYMTFAAISILFEKGKKPKKRVAARLDRHQSPYISKG